MNFEGNATNRQLHTDRSTIPVEWNHETPVSLAVKFTDESEYDSLFRATQDRLDHINLSIARINPFYGMRRAPREGRVLPMPPTRCALTVDEQAPDARPASAR